MDMLIFIGLQASGKSTFYRTHFLATHAYVSKDLLRNNKHPARRQQQLIEEALQGGRSLVIDNTNPTREDRAPLIALGYQYDAQVIGYYFEPQVKRSIERNKLRTGKERVPPVAIFATLKKLVAPTYEEGFDQLYHVLSKDNFEFALLSWDGEGSDGLIST
ncbi:MAG: ATP-binding protein [Ktedonobacteraceae bacterium]|nr:ATP-binding protein [Ktedonobacteraceae bacterium]